MPQRPDRWTRRAFAGGLTAAGVAGLVGRRADLAVAAEAPPETATIRILGGAGLCPAPMYVAEELLRLEGFTDVQYLSFPEGGVGVYQRLGVGDLDITQWFVVRFVPEVVRGAPIVFLAGVHADASSYSGRSGSRDPGPRWKDRNDELAFQAMKEIPYGTWRTLSAEDAVRFYSLRLHEARVIRSTPKRILAEGTDWRFLNELKAELKGSAGARLNCAS